MASVNAGGGIDQHVLTGLYDAHARELHRYLARRLDPSTADDLVAETFLVAWEQRRRYQPGRASARAWLYGIATNLSRRHARVEIRALRAVARSGGRAETSDALDSAAGGVRAFRLRIRAWRYVTRAL